MKQITAVELMLVKGYKKPKNYTVLALIFSSKWRKELQQSKPCSAVFVVPNQKSHCEMAHLKLQFKSFVLEEPGIQSRYHL